MNEMKLMRITSFLIILNLIVIYINYLFLYNLHSAVISKISPSFNELLESYFLFSKNLNFVTLTRSMNEIVIMININTFII